MTNNPRKGCETSITQRKPLPFRAGVAALLAAGLLAVPLIARAHVPVADCPPVKGDFMTGGGWIPLDDPACNNPKGTFGFNGGFRPGGNFHGHANYIDHCTGDHVQGDDIIAYCFLTPECPPDPDSDTCRRIVYEGRFNKADGFTIVLEVCDNGEPGRDDTFAITVMIRTGGEDCDPTGEVVYSAEGTLGGGENGGGNIQLHRQH